MPQFDDRKAAGRSPAPDPNTQLPAPFEPERYLREVERRFPTEMGLQYLTGIHPEFVGRVIDPYTNRPSEESFTNIGEHCLAVAWCAERIARALEDAGALNAAERDTIVSRALVHDLTKPYEILRRNAARAGAPIEVYSVGAYQRVADLLPGNGLSPDLARYLAEAGRETGHSSLKDFVVVSPDGFQGIVPGRLAEKIVHLADDMTSTSIPCPGDRAATEFLTPAERMETGNFRLRYPFLWKEGLGTTSSGDIVSLSDIGQPPPGVVPIGSYAELQIKVASAIAREIQILVAAENWLPPEIFALTFLNNHR